MPKTVVIANPSAGGGRVKSIWPQLAKKLRHAIGPFDLKWTTSPGDGCRLARENHDYQLIVACGGDGTLHEVANGILQRGETVQKSPLLGILSFGTGSDLIKSLGIGKNLDRQLEVLRTDREVRMDVGEIDYSTPTGREKRFFLNVADAGLGAEVLRRLGHSRKLWGRQLAYLIASVQAYLVRHPCQMEIRIDGKKRVETGMLIAAVANGRCFGGGMAIAPQADLQDGLLDLVLIKDLKSRWLPIAIASLYAKQLHHLPQVTIVPAHEIELSSPDPVFLDIDGESIGSLPARFKIRPQALRVKR